MAEIVVEQKRRRRTTTSTKTTSVDPAPAAKFLQPILLREPVDGDRAFVFQTWLKDFIRAPMPRLMDPRIYYSEQQRVVERLWPWVVIACDPEQQESILGWACGEEWFVDMGATGGESSETTGGVVHYVYVPKNFRGRGVGRRLLEAVVGVDALAGKVPLFYSHLPEPQVVRGERRPAIAVELVGKAAQYNPYLVMAR